MKKTLYLLIIIAVFATSGSAVFANSKVPSWAQNRMIAHAGGQIHGYIYTNSREALIRTCKREKIESVELDFMYTSDGKLVCTHKWYGVGKKHPVLSKFLKLKCMRKFTTMTAETAISILAEHDKNLIIDTKSSNPTHVYNDLLKICNRLELSNYKDKMIPQFYKKSEYAKAKSRFNFKNGIFTAYKTNNLTNKKLKSICAFCKKRDLVFTIEQKRFFKNYKLLKKQHIPIGVHTINSKKAFSKAKTKGASFIYSDKLF